MVRDRVQGNVDVGEFADLHSNAGRLSGELPASFLHKVSQCLFRHAEEDFCCNARTVGLVQEAQRQIAPVVDVGLLGLLRGSIQCLVGPRSLSEEARLRNLAWVAFRSVDARDAVPQRHPDLILGFSDVHTIIVMQIDVAEETRFKFDFYVEKSTQVQHWQ